MRESKIEGEVCDFAKLKSMIPYKFSSPNRRNVPDRFFICHDGFIFFIEFKATGEKASEAQMREINRLRKKEHIVFVVDNIELGKQIINEISASQLPEDWDKIFEIERRLCPTL